MTPLLPADFIQPEPANKFAHLRINLDETSFSSGCWHVTSKREVGRKRKSLKPLRFQAFLGGDWETRTLDLLRVKHAL